MPPNSEIPLCTRLLHAAQQGEWSEVEDIVSSLACEPLPSSEAGRADYLFRLRGALIAARTSRADLVKSLHRLSAASGFNQCG